MSYLEYHVLVEENQRQTAAHYVSKRLNLPEAIGVIWLLICLPFNKLGPHLQLSFFGTRQQ